MLHETAEVFALPVTRLIGPSSGSNERVGSRASTDGEKSPKIVKAAFRPVLLIASRAGSALLMMRKSTEPSGLTGSRRTPASLPRFVVSPDVKLKLVGVERPARYVGDTREQPRTRNRLQVIEVTARASGLVRHRAGALRRGVWSGEERRPF